MEARLKSVITPNEACVRLTDSVVNGWSHMVELRTLKA